MCVCERERERDRDRDRDREKDRDRETERERDRQTDRQTDRQRKRERERRTFFLDKSLCHKAKSAMTEHRPDNYDYSGNACFAFFPFFQQ